MRTMGALFIGVCVSMVWVGAAGARETEPRRVIQLDGTWQVAEGTMDSMPDRFDRKVQVPGLIDMARPAFEEVGVKSEKRQAFWYRRTFTLKGPIPEAAILKIHKARYGTKVWLNGRLVGEHLPCFTPALLDVKLHLKGQGRENILVVRVGADRGALPPGQPSGWDFEKYLYIPGIYDSVELILSGEPRIVNVQAVPDIDAQTVRVIAELQSSVAGSCSVTCEVREAKGGAVVASVRQSDVPVGGEGVTKVDIVIPLKSCRLWSPEDPFLYKIKLSTGADTAETRFGMRSFRFDRESGRAVLNGKPYFMRGTNVCAYRFFEDVERGDRPWRKEWVRRLHQKFKSMHWNSIRYCIGFPPELWYEIADEEGFLIQDEFPIWTLSEDPEKVQAELIEPEYVEWMRQRWNHPCVVIWDAQNESNTAETGKALSAVRHLDLSNRPWDNGWAEPQSEADCVEAHPYLMINLFNPAWGESKVKTLADMANVSGVPSLNAAQRKFKLPIIINEYAWLWLNRDGTTTCLTGPVYEKLLGPNSTTEQRRALYAKYLAAKTEFWRAHRACAGVLHFCGLGYSRSGDKPRPEGGATSDHFIDMERLKFEPLFEKYLRDAFSPVGIMLDYWGQDLTAGREVQIKAIAINDTYETWQGTLRLRLTKNGKTVVWREIPCTIEALGRRDLSGALTVPSEPGDYLMTGELIARGDKPICSVRDAKVTAEK
ncbi:MAG TPA: glycoside hydrolase family 2 TIM barrel-domain containing protein [Sedimentisphaerales bacterium]|nr:glycoside hydrolase family 2 TIM barrel-domain containing protein [Sedimentisphaerales bacterium]